MAEEKKAAKAKPVLLKQDFESVADLAANIKRLKKKPHPFAVYVATRKIIDRTVR